MKDMRAKRNLRLRAETIRTLRYITEQDLRRVQGGATGTDDGMCDISGYMIHTCTSRPELL